MRSIVFSSAVFAFALQGCTSSKMDVLDIGSQNSVMTGSVGPRPAGDVGTQAVQQPYPYAEENSAAVASPAMAQANVTPTASASAQTNYVEASSVKAAIEARPVETAMLRPKKVSGTVSSRARHKVYRPKFRDAKPISFGRVQPKHYAVHGVDVSRWQGNIDWHALHKHGASFAYIKATDGGDHLDRNFRRNWTNAKKAGVPRGAYHFMYWCRVASEQAEWFIRNVPKEKGALPPVIDVEWNNESRTCRTRPSRSLVLKKMKVFMDMVERHYGQKPIIYTAPDFYADNLKGEFKEYSFWLRAVAEHPSKVYPGRDFAFWQYSGTGLAKGVSEKIDLNVFNGTEKSWHRWLNARVH